MRYRSTRLPERFWEKTIIGSVSKHRPDLGPCWVWTAYRKEKGYGISAPCVGSTSRLTHRITFDVDRGAPPAEGHTVDHLCRVRACCNPKHLESVPHRINIARGDGRESTRRRESELRESATHCLRGHSYAEHAKYNDRPGAKGVWVRRCRECIREDDRKRRAIKNRRRPS